MVKIKTLTVIIKYKVGLGSLKVPEKVKNQLIEAQQQGCAIDPGYCPNYEDAAEWLSDNIKERDCMDWECEIEECDG